MQHNNSSIHQISSPGWQTLGELELKAGLDFDHTVKQWLSVILGSLNLRADFLDNVLKSAQEAASRAMQAEGVRKLEHLHLLILVPVDHAQNNSQDWGFYRIEKVEKKAGKANPVHAIELYLYRE
jgi:hypothetical protein